MTKRLDWIDFAKGIAIFLVVVGHAGRGISGAGISDADNLLSLIDATIYAFHMPLFFILSGVTFGMRPPGNINPTLLKRIWRLFYVMTIWTYAFLVLRAVSGDYSNAGGDWTDILVLPLPPFAHFWFIWALLLNVVIFSILKLVSRSFISEDVFWVGALLVAIFMHFFIEMPPALSPYFSQAMSYSIAFVVGANLGVRPMPKSIAELPWCLISTAIFLILLLASTFIELPVSRVISGIIISLCLIPLLVFITVKLGTSGWMRAIIYLGVLSLPIYVMHTMFSALLRIIFIQIGIEGLWIHLVLGAAIGVLGPLAVYLIAKRAGVLRLIGLS